MKYLFIYGFFGAALLGAVYTAQAQQMPNLPNLPPLPSLPDATNSVKQAMPDLPAIPSLSQVTPPPAAPAHPAPAPASAQNNAAPLPALPPMPSGQGLTELKIPEIPAQPGVHLTPPAPAANPNTNPAQAQNLFDDAMHKKATPPIKPIELKSAHKEDEKQIAESKKEGGEERPAKKAKVRAAPFQYRSQVPPANIFSADYDRHNKHLPRAVYPSDLDAMLFNASAKDNISAVRALLHAGVPIEVRDGNGETPLMIAARFNAINAVRLLIVLGANPNVADYAGNTPAIYAQRLGSYAMQTALMQHPVQVAMTRDATYAAAAYDYPPPGSTMPVATQGLYRQTQ